MRRKQIWTGRLSSSIVRRSNGQVILRGFANDREIEFALTLVEAKQLADLLTHSTSGTQ